MVARRWRQHARRALSPVRSRWRGVVVLAVVAAAIAHIPVIGTHLEEAPYMGALFLVLTSACVLLGVVVAIQDSLAAYALVVLTCGLALLGYIATRLVAFPMLSDDVGNWFEPLGVMAVCSEAVAAVAAAAALAGKRDTAMTITIAGSPPRWPAPSHLACRSPRRRTKAPQARS